jgi:methionine biosynthesis protein MetW
VIRKVKRFFRALNMPMPLDANFKDYDEYWDNRGFHAPSMRRAQKIAAHVEPKSSFLDVGFGDGTVMEYLIENNKPKKVIGVDISQRAVDYVTEKGLTAHAFDVLSPEFEKFMKGKKFDYIIITEVLEHIQDAETVIETLRKHVNKAIFVSIPNAGFFAGRIRLLMGRFPLVMIQQHVKEHIRFWTLKDFIYWAGYHGFNVDKVIVSSGLGVRYLAFLEKLRPSLFADQFIYKISKK